VTCGAFRCQRHGQYLVVTPLPDLAPFPVELRPGRFGFSAAESIQAVDAGDNVIRTVDFEQRGDRLRFETRRDEFAYRIRFRQ
jgi:hypothetical protein